MSQSKRPQSKATPAAQAIAVPGRQGFPTVLFIGAILALVAPNLASQSQGVDLTAAWVGIVGLVASVGLVANRSFALRPTRLLLAWGAFVIWALVSALASGRIWASLMGEPTSMLGWFLLLATTAVAVAASCNGPAVRRLLERYAWLIVLAELAWTAYGQAIASSMSAGTFFNSTYLGEGMLLLLPWTLPKTEARTPERVARYATVVVMIVALFALRSRVAAVAAVAWVLWVIARRVRVRVAYRLVAFGVLAAVVAALIVAFMPAGGFFYEPSASSLAFGGRFAWWREGALAVAERPLTGWGPGGFTAGRVAVRTLEMAAAGEATWIAPGATDPHNFLVLVAVSTGVIGVALFVWFAVETVLAWRTRARAGVDVAPSLWALGMCFAVGLTAPLTLHVWPLLALVLGVSLWHPPTPEGAPAKRPSPAPINDGRLRTAGTVVFAMITLTSAVMALSAGTRASLEVTGQGSTAAQAARSVAAGKVWPLDAYVAYLTSLHTAWASSENPSYATERTDLTAIVRAVSLDKRYPLYGLELARTVQYYQEPAERVDAAYAEAFRRYPIYPLAHAEYAVYLATNGRIDEARQHLAIAKLVDDGDPERIEAIRQAESLIVQSGG